MSLYWTVWWVIPLVLFVIGETYAIKTGTMTLSRFMWTLSKKWPLISFLAGGLVGGLAVHFLWHWCPELGIGAG